tara:strand:- start:13116 stop:13664 length:549 start_codon:yes stop_codon:yes gene_type:complete
MSKMYGVVDKLYVHNDSRVEELNNRISDRNISIRPVSSLLSVRATPTKYEKMPIVNMRSKANVQCPHVLPYDINKQFFPGNTKSPYEGYNVNTETILRNQTFALQKCEQSAYVPSSTSDLYAKTVPQKLYTGTYRSMFHKPDLQPKDVNPENLGEFFFNNHTREQRIDYGDMMKMKNMNKEN